MVPTVTLVHLLLFVVFVVLDSIVFLMLMVILFAQAPVLQTVMNVGILVISVIHVPLDSMVMVLMNAVWSTIVMIVLLIL